jgi:carbonic anhydrase
MSTGDTYINEKPKTPPEALRDLMDGNKRFVESFNKTEGRSVEVNSVEVHKELSPGVVPFAAILTCADSRVSPEIIFNCCIGDIFVVRVAGNIVDPSNYGVLGSLEFGVLELGARLIMVLGHTGCGAVAGAIDSVENKKDFPGSINTVVGSIVPAVMAVKDEPGDLWINSIVANVKSGVDNLHASAPLIAQMAKDQNVMIVGACYDLQSGEVKIVT